MWCPPPTLLPDEKALLADRPAAAACRPDWPPSMRDVAGLRMLARRTTSGRSCSPVGSLSTRCRLNLITACRQPTNQQDTARQPRSWVR